MNLLSNAVKFTPKGGEFIVIVASNNDGGIGMSVRDTGQGMTEAEVELALQPFG